jgi:topoisomerase-4 subunit B
VTKELIKIFKTDEDYWQAHVNRLNAYAESMTNISTIDKIKKDLMGSMTSNAAREKMNLPEKLSDATAGRSERLKCELFLCEGASAAGSLKSGRKNSMYHGVYALRGRTLNTINKTVDQMMESKELNGIFKSIGLGLDAINVTHEEELKLGRPLTFEERSNVIKKYARYGKICIACDADEDGLAITSSLLSTFAKFARFLLDAGMIYISESPYYIQNGKYFYPSDVQADGSVPGLDFSKEFHRIKGLGQLNKNQVYESFFDETKRKLIQVTPQNLDRAIELIADINVRKQFLRDSNILTNPFNLN